MKAKTRKRVLWFSAPVIFLLSAVMLYCLQKTMIAGLSEKEYRICVLYNTYLVKQEQLNTILKMTHVAGQYAYICALLFITSLPVAVLWNRRHKLLTIAKPTVCLAAVLNVVLFTALVIYIAAWYHINFPPVIFT